jgi:hypothetical protein
MNQILATFLGGLLALSGVFAQIWYQSRSEDQRLQREQQRQVFETKRSVYERYLRTLDNYYSMATTKPKSFFQVQPLNEDTRRIVRELDTVGDQLQLIANRDLLIQAVGFKQQILLAYKNKRIPDDFFVLRGHFLNSARKDLGVGEKTDLVDLEQLMKAMIQVESGFSQKSPSGEKEIYSIERR